MKRSIRLFLLTALALLSPAAPAAERVTYFVPDALGSPVAAMDEQGAVLWRENYAPYGERRTKAPANDAKPAYTGKPEDPETGLVYMGARMYDPETARFTGIDPQGFSEGNPQSFGRYLYANNSPYKYTDPNGETPSPVEGLLTAYDAASFAWALAYGSPMDVAEAGADLKDSLKGLAIPIPGAGWALKAARVKKGAESAASATQTGGRLANERGVVRDFEQEQDQKYYRVFSDDATQGSFLTAVPPKSSQWAQEALSLPPQNRAEMIQEVLVPAGTSMRRSRASAVPEWGRNRGGAEQFELRERIPKDNFGPGVPLK